MLANDGDPEGAAITVTHVGSQALGPDPDPFDGASPSTYTGKIASVVGTYGSLYIQEDGVFSYVLRDDDPDTDALTSGQTVEDIFAYTVRDASGLTRTANIRIKVGGVTDVVAITDVIEVSEAAAPGTFTGNIFTNDRGFTPTATVKSALGGPLGSLATPYGTLTVQANGDYSFVLANNAATNAVAAGAVGSAEFILIVTEQAGGPDRFSFISIKVNGINDAPIANADAAAITEDAAANTVTGNVRTNDSDPDFDPLSVTAVAGGSVGQARQGTYGSVVINSNGSYTYTLDNGDPDTDALAPGQSAFDDFTYTIADGKGGTATAVLRVTVNGAPNLVTGTSGNDTLDGTALPDTLSGLGGDDVLSGLGAADTLDGGDGTDTASYAAAGAGVTVNLANLTQNTGDAAGDTYVSIERIVGSSFADMLLGDAAANVFDGGAGADTIDGGAGFDTASYASASAGVTVNLGTPSLNTGDAAGDVLISIERIIGTGFDDLLVGQSAAFNNLDGGAGNDSLVGGAANDQLTGGAGADMLDGGDSSSAVNTALYTRSSAGVDVNLTTGMGSGGDAQGDQLVNIDDVSGSAFNDVLTGSLAANRLSGGDGADTLAGLGGDDVLAGGLGADTIDGGDGFDFADYAFSSEAVAVDLGNDTASGGDAAGDVIGSNVEGLIGSGFADTLIGDAGDNALIGGAGADTLTGGGGADGFRFDLLLLDGQADTITDFQQGVDHIQFFNTGPVTSFDFVSGTNPVATSGNPTFLYNTSTGVLLYDGQAHHGVVVAVFATPIPLDASDIQLI